MANPPKLYKRKTKDAHQVFAKEFGYKNAMQAPRDFESDGLCRCRIFQGQKENRARRR